MTSPLLEVNDLEVRLHGHHSSVHAVRGISYRVEAGRTLAIVGESGCGKSVSALALLGLIAGTRPELSGRATFDGADLITMGRDRLRTIRGRDIGMIFQDPLSALHPMMTIGVQLGESIRTRHHGDRLSIQETLRRTAGTHGDWRRRSRAPQLSPRAFGRTAAASDDLDGVGRSAATTDCR